MTTDSDSGMTQKGDLVVVGSSAGGIGALSTLVSTLNKNFPAPIVLAQHLDPQRPSHLGTILERRSTLPIVVVREDPPTPLESGTIYVVPANRHVTISDGVVLLDSDHVDRPKPSIDRLLSSAAEVYGEHMIAVILTGSGSDGAAGAIEVKKAGGVVIVQNPQTAAYPSMPLSLPPTAVDHVVDVEEIALVLYDLLKGVNLPATEEKIEDPLHDLLAQVSSQTNIDFRNYKASTILRRIGRRMAITHNVTIREYGDYLQNHSSEVQELVKAFLIKVTGFFRDPEAYEVLKKTVIPELVERAAENGKSLRLWSAGCATGEEAYSLALLFAEYLGSDFPEWNIKIFATDVATDAINFARRAVYPENVLNELPLDYKERFFEHFENGFRVSKLLRQSVIFGEQDISRSVPFPRIDLVSCRNLLIYLKPEMQQVVLDSFAYSLHYPRGFLFLGKAETTRPSKANFELVDKKWKIYRCLGGPTAFPANDVSRSLRMPAGSFRDLRKRVLGGPLSNSSEMTEAEIEVSHLRRISETVLRYMNVAVVIIDRGYRIVTLNSAARRLLSIRDIAYDQDFLHTVRGMPYHDVRKAIDNAFHERSTSTLTEIELDHSAEGSGRYVNITIMVMQTEQSTPELAVISAVDVTEVAQMKKRLESVQREQAEMVNELSEANRRYSAMNKELQDANEELQAANEELMLTQEELQATNEEFEATNEELQATNEELETNNEELQATNEELQTTNDELTSRTSELYESGKQHRVEQLQISSLLERFPHYVMVLNAADLTIQSINRGYQELFGNRKVVGLTINEVFSGRQLETLINLLQTASHAEQAITSEPMKANAEGAGDSSFVHTIVPISDVATGNVDRLFIYSEKME
ncbi:MAG TPA: CheR family methyltransferase [Pyrinomonadaceae bacterium]|jgi:two-component system CheB/CheR fusion protein|nr:CheR family methyltransferase [Pyrinomonadaceae bacterium]